MLSSADLIHHICAGRNIRVSRGANETRTISIIFGLSYHRDFELPLAAYDALMSDVMQGIAARSDLRVDFKQDFYGRQWLEVRSGLLGLRVSRLHISPRHIQMLQSLVVAQQQDEVAV